MDRKGLVEAALGTRPLDLVIKNVRLVNVFTGEVYPAEIGIYGERIVHVSGPLNETNDEAPLEAKKVIDGDDCLAVPGLIDSHVHIESSMLTPGNFAAAVLPHGTTTVITDPHEIGNVMGLDGVRYMLQASENLPMRQYILAPSCVPSVPGVETAGADFLAPEIEEMLSWDRVLGLAEVMDYIGVINQDPRMVEILDAARRKGAFIQGHSPFLSGRALSAYLCAGPTSDHEVRADWEALAKLRAGMTVDARESSISRNIEAIMRSERQAIHPVNLTLCTDDREPADILHEGHMNHVVRRAIQEGVEPAIAVRYATLQAARSIGLSELGAIVPGKLADIALVESFETMRARRVFVGGQLVAEDGKLTVTIEPYQSPVTEQNTVKLARPLSVEDFTLRAPVSDGTASVRVVTYADTGSLGTEFTVEELPVTDGVVDISGDPDLCYVGVIERHGRTGNMALGVIRNFGLQAGAVASTVSHDCHNLTVVARTADDALAACSVLVDCGGGLSCVQNGEVTALLELPIAGLLSPLSAEELAPRIERVKETMRGLGMPGENPLLRVATLTLAVIPKAKITDMGLVEVETQRLLPVFVDE